MTTEAERSDAPGQSAAAEQPSAETDIKDLDTPEVEADEQQPEEGSEEGEGEQAAAPGEPVDDGTEEFDLNGKKLKIPRDIKPLLMFQADYTRKTQELAEQRRALAESFQQQAAASQERIAKAGQLANAEEMIRRYQTEINWDQLEAEEPQTAQRRVRELQQWQYTRETLSRDIAALDAQAAQTQRHYALQAQQEAAQRMQEAQASLHRDIPNWKENGPKAGEFAMRTYGFTPQELSTLTDPRFAKLMYDAYQGHELRSKQQAAAKQRTQQPKAPPEAVAPLQTVTPKSAGPTGRRSLEDLSKSEKIDDFAAAYEKTYGKQRARR